MASSVRVGLEEVQKKMGQYADKVHQRYLNFCFMDLTKDERVKAIEEFGAELVEETVDLLASARYGMGRLPTREDHINRLRILDYIEKKEAGENKDWSDREIAEDLKLKREYVSELFCWMYSNGDVTVEA